MRPMLFLLALFVHVLAPASFAQEANPLASYIQLHYTKQEHRVAMRDGVKLFTAVYSPRDTTKTWPILMKRTPYGSGPYGVDKMAEKIGPSEEAVKAGYIFVIQDVRGRFQSDGEFQQVTPHVVDKKGPKDVDESSDTYDTIEWLLKNVSGHNGRVGMFGVSYPGFYCSAGMIDAHPALKAVSPQAPVGDWYFDDFLHNGAFFLAHAYRWLGANAQPRPQLITERPEAAKYATYDGYQFFLDAATTDTVYKQHLKENVPFWAEMMAHPNRDEFWQKRDILPHLKNVAPQVMTVTGWFDAEDLYGSFKTYRSVEALNPKVNNVLVVGPWHHGGWYSTDGEKLGPATFGSKTAAFYRAEIELKFFEKYLKDADTPGLAEATLFETGANTWRTFDAWPPKSVQPRTYLFREGGLLAVGDAGQKPSAGGGEKGGASLAYDEYVSDPAKPVPSTETIAPGMPIEYMVDDQRFAARRPDVLVYQTPPLTEDLVLAGPMTVDLWVSTTGRDADFIVKLIDVNPAAPEKEKQPGYQMMVRSEVFRGRFRNSFEKPEPFEPGVPTRVRIDLLDVLHRFKKDHRLMVHIQSTWFPLVDRNPQSWVPNIHFAKPEDFQKATHRLYRDTNHPTSLTVGVLP
ncbi:CocE/NonD family hydrolase [Planctomyces sp. SH-PL14]|uniref:CocE/NonD family hydrolase n=1 Tax=Planctomyces sp. SH-PL14 TaxID=1632864 RepID=UPI00078EE4F2|nr:CocE/NonD family hydrolase [Planctomyces sp. SH-PL14]AMV17625.1 Cocaine esterase [Planctomyces sp. SH-PL14]